MRMGDVRPEHKRLAVGLAVLCACLGALVVFVEQRRADLLSHLASETELVTSQISDRILSILERSRLALTQFARQLDSEEKLADSDFYELASNTLKANRALFRLSFVDPEGRIRWVFPLEANRSMVGVDLRSNPLMHAAVERAIERRAAVFSEPLHLFGGYEGFVLAVPLVRDGEVAGVLTGSCRTTDLLTVTLVQEVLEGYDMSLMAGAKPLFLGVNFEADAARRPTASEEFRAGDSVWTLSLRPQTEVVQAVVASTRGIYWPLGALLALLAAAAALLARGGGAGGRGDLAARERAHSLPGAQVQLRHTEKMVALGELVAGVAHEINNPLCTILGYSQLLLARDVTPEVRARLERVQGEADRIAKMVSNLLTFARKHPAEKKRLGLNGIVEKTLELKSFQLRGNHIEIEKHLARDLPFTLLDFHQMQQVVLNLVNNAEQAIVESRHGSTIRLTTRSDGARIELRVADDGPGIPPEIQERIFEPFFTTRREGKGTGLGLSLCFGIVQEHGGGIRLESQPGQGSTFVVDLPVIASEDDAQASAQGTASDAVSHMRVLVIDSDPAVLDFLVEMLGARGHSVDTASDAPEALKKIAAGGYDLFITDMKMPRGTGKDIYHAVAQRDPQLAARIVFTSGAGASSQTIEFVRDAGSELILKPFGIDQIEKALASAVRH